MAIEDHGLSPALSAEHASWILDAFRIGPGVFEQLEAPLRYGPPGFEVYARIAFFLDSGEYEEGHLERDRIALQVLAGQTRTPDVGYAAIWEGWCGTPSPVDAPVVDVPYRTMLLFTGPVTVLHDAPHIVWDGKPSWSPSLGPAYVWPEDRAWLVTCEVDEEVEFTVGCSAAAFDELATALPGAVRRVAYGAAAPMYEDDLTEAERSRRDVDAILDQDPEPRG